MILLVAATATTLVADETLTLEIEDEDVGVWMAINNAFSRVGNEDWNPGDKYWNGVLIQLGDFETMASSHAPMEVFHSVVFKEGSNEVLTLSRADFKSHLLWVNVVARDQDDDRDDPMTANDLDRLKLDPPSRLHRYLHPIWGGITLWQGREEGYGVASTTLDDDLHPHAAYSFRIIGTEEVEVQVYKDGVADSEHDLSDVDTILVRAEGDISHGGHRNPPQE